MSSALLRTSAVLIEGYSRLLGRQLDIKDLTILTTISKIGSRNISEIARKAGLPITTTYRRINALRRIGLRYIPTVIPEKIGLTRLLVMLDRDIASSKRFPADHWLSTYMPLISHPGAVAIYYTPVDRPQLIEYYLRRDKRDSLIVDYQIIPIINAFNSPEDLSEYYDILSRSIMIPWEKWLRILERENFESISPSDVKLPPIMLKAEPAMPRDSLDLLILKELETDSLASFTEIAKRLRVPEYSVRFHYYSHIQEPGVIYNYVVNVPLFNLNSSYYILYLVKFSSFESLERVLSIFWRSPILISVAKLDGRMYDMAMWFLVPTSEAGKLSILLKIAAHLGYIKRIRSFVVDWTHYVRRSIPYKNFDGDLRRWIDKP